RDGPRRAPSADGGGGARLRRRRRHRPAAALGRLVARLLGGAELHHRRHGGALCLRGGGEHGVPSRAIKEGARFDGMALPPEVARQLLLLKLSSQLPAPSDAKERAELAALEVGMTGMYGKGKYCPERLASNPRKKCLSLDDLENIMEKSRKYDDLLDAWRGWHAIAPPIRPKFERYVALGNEGAREIGFHDLGELWRSGYDMSPAAFEADTDRLWAQVEPLYDKLHCYVRAKLRKVYGADKIGPKAPIPAHLLGNMWAQEWQNIYDLVEPYKGEAPLDVTKKIKAK